MDPEIKGRYERLLGAYIAKTTEIEALIDHAVGRFFGVDERLFLLFDWWLMGRMEFGRKLEVLHRLLEYLKIKDEFRPLLKGLTAMMERRNDLAHGHYIALGQQTGDGSYTLTLAKTHLKSSYEPSKTYVDLDLDELETELGGLTDLMDPLIRLYYITYKMFPRNQTEGVAINMPTPTDKPKP